MGVSCEYAASHRCSETVLARRYRFFHARLTGRSTIIDSISIWLRLVWKSPRETSRWVLRHGIWHTRYTTWIWDDDGGHHGGAGGRLALIHPCSAESRIGW